MSKFSIDSKKIIKWLSVEGVSAILIIVGSLLISVLSFFDVISFEQNKLVAVNAAILSILASLSVANSIKLVGQADYLQKLTEQADRNDLPSFVIKKRSARPDIEEFTDRAKRVLVCDMFFSSIQLPQHLLVKLIESRCDVQIIVLDPMKEEILLSMSNLATLEPLDNLKKLLQAGITNIAQVYQLYINENSRTFELRYCNNLIPFSCVLVETFTGEDKIIIENIPFKYDELKVHRHHFVLEKKYTPDLFESYKESLERLIKESELKDMSTSNTLF